MLRGQSVSTKGDRMNMKEKEKLKCKKWVQGFRVMDDEKAKFEQ